MTTTISIGRALMLASNLFLAAGSFINDFNETHVFNPRWPPHARFHNGQTMTSSLLYTAAVAFFLFFHQPDSEPVPQPVPDSSSSSSTSSTSSSSSTSLLAAAVIGSFYAVSGLSGILYPGSLAIDPEFGQGFPQFYVFGLQLVLNWVGYWLERRRLGMGMGIGMGSDGKYIQTVKDN